MVNSKYPKNPSDPEFEKAEEPYVHQPEFIILEDVATDNDIGGLSHEELEYLKSFHNLNKVHHSFLFRLFMLGVSFIVLLASVILLLAVSGSTTIAALGLFRNAELNKPVLRFWRGFKRLLVTSVGLFLAFFSPALGFSLIIVYFFLLGEPTQEDLVSRIIKTRFTRN